MKNESNNLSVSAEDYLEAALCLTLQGERIKVTSIAEKLGVSKPAVTNALNELAAKGYLQKQPYGDIRLTDEGQTAAQRVYDKHKLLRDFLCALGVSPQAAEIDCCKIEHDLCDETIACIRRFMRK
ncbi:MAG: metal-dependent transcriptional regulator [Clostridia bacterium]|jgi:DtxR family Mn-dependent transcriptional regulator|nr:metal-dependent transcriptional regulator [Clostridia bacterium]